MQMEYNELLDERVYKHVLDNGLEIVILPKKAYISKQAYFFTAYGSNNNSFIIDDKRVDMPYGVAHFLEHKIFEDTEKNIFETFASNNGSVNAYTNFTSTCYYFSCTDSFDENLTELLSFVQSPYLTDENVEKEKGIIAQEIRMYDDNPDWRVYFNALQAMYKNHPVRLDIAGTVESINTVTKEDLMLCYNAFYVPQNMKIVVTGDVDPEETIELIKKNLKVEFVNPKSPVETVYPQELGSIAKKLVEEELEVASPDFFVGYKDIPVNLDSKALVTRGIATSILCDLVFGKTSPLYQRLYESGLINQTFGFEVTFEQGYSHVLIGGETKDPHEVTKAIQEEVERLKVSFVESKSFERIRKKMIGRFLKAYNSIEYIGRTYVSYLNRGLDLFQYLEVLESIELSELQERLEELFVEERRVLSIIKPKSTE